MSESRRLRERGRLAAEAVAAAVDDRWRRRVVAPLVRHHGHPSLYELSAASSGRLNASAPASVMRLLGTETRSLLDAITTEFVGVWTEIEGRLKASRAMNHPEVWALEREPALMMYLTTRLMNPATVVETGVADGLSTMVFLRALAANARGGELHSVDVDDDVARLLTAEERSGWDLRVLPKSRRRQGLKTILADVPAADLFFHDSDHSYAWQRFEYEEASRRMLPGSILLSDDADASYALLDFCASKSLRPQFFAGELRVFGCCRL